MVKAPTTYSFAFPYGEKTIERVEGEFRNGRLNGTATRAALAGPNGPVDGATTGEYFENWFLVPGLKFWCDARKTYYPNVRECPGDWQPDYSETTPMAGVPLPPPPPGSRQ